MAKSDLQGRSIYYRTTDSIEAHLTIVFAALAVSRWIEYHSGWSIRKFVRDRLPLPHHPDPGRAANHHRSRPLPNELRQALDHIRGPSAAH